VNASALVEVLFEASAAAYQAAFHAPDSGPTARPGQYGLDVAADAAALAKLHGAGLSVLSEESGWTEGDSSLVAILDPIDGSTNAYRHIPFFSTSICVFDRDGPWVGSVVDHGSGRRFHAIREEGSWKDGDPIGPSKCASIEQAVVGIAGPLLNGAQPWQYRALGSASLEFCLVAEGSLDAFVLGHGVFLHPWDYLAGLLICREAGAAVSEASGRDPWVAVDSLLRPLAAGPADLMAQLISALGT
jgi:myo-inositol-1(or 4)-monophosphatase